MDKKKLTKRIKAHSFFILTILLCWYFYQSTGRKVFGIMTVGLVIIYLMLFLMGLLMRGSTLMSNNPKEISMEEAKKKINQHENISDWTKVKGIITRFIPDSKIVENGQVTAQLFAFYIQTERDANVLRSDKAFISGHIIPVSHIGSFGINTPVDVIVNKTGAWAVFDPENENWHYKVKKQNRYEN